MKQLSILLAAMVLSAAPTYADGYEFEAGFTFANLDGGGVDVDLGAIYGIAGYRWDHANNYSSSAEVLVALGVTDDDLFGVDVSLEPSYSVGYKGTWRTSTDDLSFFWRASYATVEVEVDGFGSSGSVDESGFGVGVGADWRRFTIGYTTYLGDLDDFSAINIGFKF